MALKCGLVINKKKRSHLNSCLVSVGFDSYDLLGKNITPPLVVYQGLIYQAKERAYSPHRPANH